jgi:hypothetical protein
MKGKPVTQQEKNEILKLIQSYPPAEICRIMKRSPSVVYSVLRDRGINSRAMSNIRYWKTWKKEQENQLVAESKERKKPVPVKKAPPEPMRRPPAQYSNTGFLSLTEKYAG